MHSDAYEFLIKKRRAIGYQYDVSDGSGQILYQLQRKQLSFGNLSLVTDEAGNEVAKIRRMFSMIVPKYQIAICGQAPFSVRRKFSLSPSYLISGYPWTVMGASSRYRCYTDDTKPQLVFDFLRQVHSWTEETQVNIYHRDHILHGICIAVAINAAIDDIRRTGKK